MRPLTLIIIHDKLTMNQCPCPRTGARRLCTLQTCQWETNGCHLSRDSLCQFGSRPNHPKAREKRVADSERATCVSCQSPSTAPRRVRSHLLNGVGMHAEPLSIFKASRHATHRYTRTRKCIADCKINLLFRCFDDTTANTAVKRYLTYFLQYKHLH